jgi:hypothetical protein
VLNFLNASLHCAWLTTGICSCSIWELDGPSATGHNVRRRMTWTSLSWQFPYLILTELDSTPPCNVWEIPHKVPGANLGSKRQANGLDQGCKHNRLNEIWLWLWSGTYRKRLRNDEMWAHKVQVLLWLADTEKNYQHNRK